MKSEESFDDYKKIDEHMENAKKYIENAEVLIDEIEDKLGIDDLGKVNLITIRVGNLRYEADELIKKIKLVTIYDAALEKIKEARIIYNSASESMAFLKGINFDKIDANENQKKEIEEAKPVLQDIIDDMVGWGYFNSSLSEQILDPASAEYTVAYNLYNVTNEKYKALDEYHVKLKDIFKTENDIWEGIGDNLANKYKDKLKKLIEQGTVRSRGILQAIYVVLIDVAHENQPRGYLSLADDMLEGKIEWDKNKFEEYTENANQDLVVANKLITKAEEKLKEQRNDQWMENKSEAQKWCENPSPYYAIDYVWVVDSSNRDGGVCYRKDNSPYYIGGKGGINCAAGREYSAKGYCNCEDNYRGNPLYLYKDEFCYTKTEICSFESTKKNHSVSAYGPCQEGVCKNRPVTLDCYH